MISILFLASSGGGNMKFFDLAGRKGIIDKNRIGIIADRECASLKYARNNNLQNYLVDYDRANSKDLLNAIEDFSPDIIVTNWYKILGEDVVQKYKGKLVNLHYSLLPAFGGGIGVKPIKDAIQRGCKYIGPTCHLVDEGVDTGYILSQHAFKISLEFNESVNNMFRYGCLVLLTGIEVITDSRASKKNLESLRYYIDSKICFFDESFWLELSEL